MSEAVTESKLTGPLEVLLPTAAQTQLLRACLLPGEEGLTAWHCWCSQVANPNKVFEDSKVGLKGLLPLVRKGLERTGFSDNRGLLTYARAAYLHEERRTKAYTQICAQVLSALAKAEIPVLPLKACVVAATVYDELADRHCHALDLLVRREDLARAGKVIEEQEFAYAKIQLSSTPDHKTYRHRHGLPLELHAQALLTPYFQMPWDQMWARRVTATVSEISVPVLSPADNLLQICGRAAEERTRATLRWVCDAHQIVTRCPDLDWQVFQKMAKSSGLALPLFVMLRYLANELDTPIPETVIESLGQEAERANDRDREAALYGALTGLTASRQAFGGALNWRERLTILGFLLAPSSACLSWSYPNAPRLALPFLYLLRPLHYVVSRVRGLLLPVPNED